ncbi:MAG: lysostaphin resistance A-like protein [Maricaulaceae bacterium]
MARIWTAVAILLGLGALVYYDDGLYAIPGVKAFFQDLSATMRLTIRFVVQFAGPIVLLALIARMHLAKSVAHFGLGAPRPLAIALPVMAVIPLYAVFAATQPVQTEINPVRAFQLALFYPFLEEMVFRGFAFGALRRVCKFNFWVAALLPAAGTALVHLYQANDAMSVVMTLLIAGLGGVFFSWIYERWGFNIWIPTAMHALMNLAWNVFDIGSGAFAGWLPTVMQVTTLITAVTLTLYLQRRRSSELQPA